MAKGDRFPPESRWLRDEQTSACIRQITSHASIHHQPFFLVPAYDDAMRWTLFTSARLRNASDICGGSGLGGTDAVDRSG